MISFHKEMYAKNLYTNSTLLTRLNGLELSCVRRLVCCDVKDCNDVCNELVTGNESAEAGGRVTREGRLEVGS